MEVLVNVKGQKLTYANSERTLVAGSQEFVKFVFQMDEDWSPLNTFAQFSQFGSSYNVYLDSSYSAYLPIEIVSGIFTVALQGNLGYTIGKSNALRLSIEKDPIVSDAMSTQISQSLYDQVAGQIGSLQTRVSALEGDDYTAAEIQENVERIMQEYLEADYFAAMSIGDGSISRAKINAAFEADLQNMSAAISAADTKAGSKTKTIVVSTLPSVSSADTTADYILNNSDGCLYYRVINGEWVMVGGSVARVYSTELPETGNTFTDYYLDKTTYYEHYRWYDSAFHLVGVDSYTKSEVGQIITYKPIEITAFSISPSQAEMGSTVSSVTATYTFNKAPATATINGSSITAQTTGSESVSLSATENTTITLAGTDSGSPAHNAASTSKSVTLTFLNKVYYGAYSAQNEYDSAFLLGLSGSALASSKAKTVTVNAGSGQYIYYASPTRFGTCNFNVGGFDGGFTLQDTISHTNASGYTENYYIYRSDNANLGNTTVKIT